MQKTNRLCIARNSLFLPVSGSPGTVRLCHSCLRHFGNFRKTHTHTGFLQNVSCGFCHFLMISGSNKCSDEETNPGCDASSHPPKRARLNLPQVEIGTHMSPYGTIWVHMGLIWTDMGAYGPYYGPTWVHMGSYGPILAHRGPYGPIWTRTYAFAG